MNSEQKKIIELGQGLDKRYGNIDDLDPAVWNAGQMLIVSRGRGDDPRYGNVDGLNPMKWSASQMNQSSMVRGGRYTWVQNDTDLKTFQLGKPLAGDTFISAMGRRIDELQERIARFGYNSEALSEKWDMRFLKLAKHIALWSKDPRTQVGAVIVRDDRTICSMGYNGFPRSVEDHEAHYIDLEIKHSRVIHAEMNAVLQAPEPVRGHTLYCNFMPCRACMLMLIQAGIRRVVCYRPDSERNERWNCEATRDLAVEAKVDLMEYVI